MGRGRKYLNWILWNMKGIGFIRQDKLTPTISNQLSK